jgi:hypothetical protein
MRRHVWLPLVPVCLLLAIATTPLSRVRVGFVAD